MFNMAIRKYSLILIMLEKWGKMLILTNVTLSKNEKDGEQFIILLPFIFKKESFQLELI